MKKLLQHALLLLRDLIVPLAQFQEIAVLCYHSISDAPIATAIRPEAFERQLEYLRAQGYVFISLDALIAWMAGERPLPQRAIALTFDDGYADFETAALPILEQFHAPVTLFVMGDGAASRIELRNDIPLLTPEALGQVRNHPLVTLGYHSLTHTPLAALPPDALTREMTPTFPAPYFAYPGGNYSDAARAMARDLGYRAAFSIKRHLVEQTSRQGSGQGSDPYLLPRSVVTRDMSARTVRFHATRALEWYRALGNLR